jgi:CheY-like chemotaxis protein
MAAINVPSLPSPRTILVVDDNDNDAELVRLMFRRSRILNPVQVVITVHDAICYLKGEGQFSDRNAFPFPVLMLVDSHLPDASGFDLLRWLQGNKPESPLVAVMLTGSDVNALKRSYEVGAKSFLIKPLKFEEFQNMVQGVSGIKLTTTDHGHVVEPES